MAPGRYKVDLAGHMAECDANYARLHRLLPELFDSDVRSVRLPLPGPDEGVLVFRVIARAPYTTDVAVHFRGRDARWHEMIPAPSLDVRLYHDASTAEVTRYQGSDRFRGRYDYPNTEMRLPDEKAQLNRFLGEYLALCIEHGREERPVVVGDR